MPTPAGGGGTAPPFCSSVVNEAVKGSHSFEVRGFSLAKGIGVGRFLTSNTFAVGGYDWAIYFYPDGKNPEDASSYVSVFVALASEGVDVRAMFELTLVDQSGRGRNKVHSHFDRAPGDGPPYTLKYRGSMWGYKRFYKRSGLETSDYVKNDSLILKCTVGVVRTRLETPRNFVISVPPSCMGNYYKKLLTSGIDCDVTFEVGDETFRAHRIILAARSPVFMAQFFGGFGNPKLDKVVVEDVEPVLFKIMIHFIYTDELPNVDELANSILMCTPTVLVQHLLAVADRYGLDRLRVMCEAKLSEGLTPDTVASTLALAGQHQCTQLKLACLKFIVARENLGAVIQTEGYQLIEETCPHLLSDLLVTKAEAENDVVPTNYKRSVSSNIGVSTGDAVDAADQRRVRRRM